MSNTSTTKKPAKDSGKDVAKNYSISELAKSPIQLTFGILAALTLCGLIPFTLKGYWFVLEAESKKPEGYVFPSIKDMQMTAIASVGFAILEIVARRIAFSLFEPFCKVQDNVKERELRSGKAAFCIYKALYFMWASAWGYMVLKD